MALELLHPVEGGAGAEPLDLRLVEAVVELQRLLAAVAVLHHCRQRLRGNGGLERDLLTGRRAKPHTYLSRSEGFESSDGDLVVGADSVVV